MVNDQTKYHKWLASEIDRLAKSGTPEDTSDLAYIAKCLLSEVSKTALLKLFAHEIRIDKV